MDKEKKNGDQPEQQQSNKEKKIHQTHFPVTGVSFRENKYDSGYEWKQTCNGRWIRVLKKK